MKKKISLSKILFSTLSIGVVAAVPITMTSCSKSQQTEAQKIKLTSYIYDGFIATNPNLFTKQKGETFNKDNRPLGSKYWYWNLELSNWDYDNNVDYISAGFGFLYYKNNKWDSTRHILPSTFVQPALVFEKAKIKYVENGLLVQPYQKPKTNKQSLPQQPKAEGHYEIEDVMITNYYVNGELKTDFKPIGNINVYSVLNKSDIRPELSVLQQKWKLLLGQEQYNEYLKNH